MLLGFILTALGVTFTYVGRCWEDVGKFMILGTSPGTPQAKGTWSVHSKIFVLGLYQQLTVI